MYDTIDKRSTKMNVDTFPSIQTIKYGLKARNRDAYLKKCRYDADMKLVRNLSAAHSVYVQGNFSKTNEVNSTVKEKG